MDSARVVELLKTLQSSDNTQRKAAEQLYNDTKKSNPIELANAFISILPTSNGHDETIRTSAAVMLRKLLSAGSDDCWTKLSPEAQAVVKTQCIALLNDAEQCSVMSKIGDIVICIASRICASGTDAWPELVPCVSMMGARGNAKQREVAFEIFANICVYIKSTLLQNATSFAQLLTGGLSDEVPTVRAMTINVITEMASHFDKAEWQPLCNFWPQILEALKLIIETPSAEDAGKKVLEDLIDLASAKPIFFKSHATEVTALLVAVAKNSNIDEALRVSAFEVLVTLSENKPNMMIKNVPNFCNGVLECCLSMMNEMEDDESWKDLMEDEEDDDEDGLYSSAEMAMDRLVGKLTINNCGAALFAAIGQYAAMDSWTARHAAMVAIRQTVEYFEDDEHIKQCAALVFTHISHPHMRVRYDALHALGQMANDHQEAFSEMCHGDVMPHLLKAMDDPIHRVSAMAMSAFVCFGESLDNTIMSEYSTTLVTKLVGKLQVPHRCVQEEALTSIAAIAGVLEKEFAIYYDDILPIVKRFVQTCISEKERRLRGKAFECLSLLGLAVGRERFLPDASDALEEMMKKPCEADDLSKEYIKEASERICRTLKGDFVRFLPYLLPDLYKSIKVPTPVDSVCDDDDDDDDEFYKVPTGENQHLRIHTSEVEDMRNAVDLLGVFVEETGAAFMPHVQLAAQTLLPLLEASDELILIFDECRSAAYSVWSHLIAACRLAGNEVVAKELLGTYVDRILKNLKNETDSETIYEAASGMASCIRSAGANGLDINAIIKVNKWVLDALNDSIQRADEEEDEEDDDEEEAVESDKDDVTEYDCQIQLNAVFGAIMETSPDNFMQVAAHVLGQKLTEWTSSTHAERRVLGLHLACDFLEHLKERSMEAWSMIMPPIFSSLADNDRRIRTAAAFGINLLARIPAFHNTPQAPQAVQAIMSLLQANAPSKRDSKGNLAYDNATCALIMMLTYMPQHFPEGVDSVWQLAFSKLPLKQDAEEAKKLNAFILEQITAQNPNVLGAGNCRLGKCLGYLSEVYNNEEQVEEELKEKIAATFKAVPADFLVSMKSQFTDKQMKKIQKILA